mmetsp:Transcript_28681/g.52380  ORF Transcript_28681/g.52380 Transcript_28681/m.52380 type:complete len:231 (-) Transcript_28681:671-1363(-)
MRPSQKSKRPITSTARKWHPDENPSEDAKIKFQSVGDAYRVLSDENLRKVYDRDDNDGLGGDETEAVTESVDPSLVFAFLFGDDSFDDIAGRLRLATQTPAGARRDRRWHFATEYEYSRMAIRTTDTAGGRSGHPRGRNSGRCAAENEYRIRSARCTNSRPRKLREVGPRGTRMPNRGRRGRKGMPRSAPPRPRGRRGVRRGGPTRRTRRRPPRSRRRGARPSWMYYPAP